MFSIEHLDAFAPAGGRGDGVAIGFKRVAQRFDPGADRRPRSEFANGSSSGGASCSRRACAGRGNRESQAHAGPLPGGALDLNLGAMPLDDAIDHGQAQAGAALALGCEERLKAATPCFLVHPETGVGYLQVDVLRSFARSFPPGEALARRVSVPPSGMASTALKIRLVSASRISLSIPAITGGF